MKRIIFLFLFVGAAFHANAQAKTKVRIIERVDSDTVVVRQGDTVIYIKESIDTDSIHFRSERFDVKIGPDGVLVTKNDDGESKRIVTRVLLMDIGFAGYLSEGSFNLPADQEYLDLRFGRSRNVNLQLFTQRVRFANNHMNFSYGLMFEFNKYRLENDVRLLESSSPLMWEDAGQELRKDKLKAAYLYLPLMFGVESNPDKIMKSFRARAGFYAGVLTSSKQKLVAEITDREKTRDDFNLNRFRYGIRGEMGYGLINFYVHYSLAPMFKEDQGPELQPINFGIMLFPF